MKENRKFIVISFILLLFSDSYGAVQKIQETHKYYNEELKAINQIIYKLIDAERLSSFNKSDKSLTYAFDTRLICNLEEISSLNYQTNDLIEKLKRKGIADRTIDSTSIGKFEKIRFIFFDNDTLISKVKGLENYAGCISLSRISFNRSLSVGYLLYSVYMDNSSGWGGLIRIEKKNGNWKIASSSEYII